MTRATWFANGIEGRHVLFGLMAFFGVMVLANAAFVYFAVTTHSGGDTSSPYRKGLQYNETLAADALQTERGWQTKLEYDDQTGRLKLSVFDEAAAPISALQIKARLSRPATDREDRSVELSEVSQGVYATDIRLAPGAWVVSVASKTRGTSESFYRVKRRLFVAEAP